MRIFKLILAVALMMFVVNSSALAARHSTPEEMRYALNESVHVVRKTDGYFSIFSNNPDYGVLHSQLEICRSSLRKIQSIRELDLVGGREARTCVALALIILLNRESFLEHCISAVQARLRKDDEDFRYYHQKAMADYAEAEKWRAKFKADYGY